jgi:hypothetical protein
MLPLGPDSYPHETQLPSIFSTLYLTFEGSYQVFWVSSRNLICQMHDMNVRVQYRAGAKEALTSKEWPFSCLLYYLF